MPAPVFDAATAWTPAVNNTANGSATWNHTCTGTNRYLLVFAANVMDYPASATYNGVAMLPLHLKENTYRLIGFYLPAPASGSNAVVVNWGHIAGGYEPTAISISFTGIDPTVQFGTPVTNSGNSAAATVTCDTAADELVAAVIWSATAATATTGQTQRATTTGAGAGQSRMQVATNTAGTNTWTLSSEKWMTLALSLKPVGATGRRPIPAYELFLERLLRAGEAQCDVLDTNYADYIANGVGAAGAVATYSEGGTGSYYYDWTHVAYKAATFVDDIDAVLAAHFRSTAGKGWDVLDAAYYVNPAEGNGYHVPGYKHFVRGPTDDFNYRGTLGAKAAVLALRDTPAYALDANSLSYTIVSPVGNMLQRELAYHMAAHVYSAQLGHAPRTARYQQCVEWAYEYFEHWFPGSGVKGWEGTSEEMHPFMVGLLARAIIEDYAVTGDVRALPALREACDVLWSDAWDAESLGMLYQLNSAYEGEGGDGTNGRSVVGAPVLNNLITSMYAWVAVHAGDEFYMRQADLMFAGSAFCIGDQVGKQFNQQHTWIFGDDGYLGLRE